MLTSRTNHSKHTLIDVRYAAQKQKEQQMKIKIENLNYDQGIVVERSIFDGIAITQGLDHVYVNEDMIRQFVSAVNVVAKDILGEAVE
jgi:hypothetical protein